MFVRAKTHLALQKERRDILATYSRQARLLSEAQQIFQSIPPSRLSQSVKEQIAEWQKDVAVLEQQKGEQV